MTSLLELDLSELIGCRFSPKFHLVPLFQWYVFGLVLVLMSENSRNLSFYIYFGKRFPTQSLLKSNQYHFSKPSIISVLNNFQIYPFTKKFIYVDFCPKLHDAPLFQWYVFGLVLVLMSENSRNLSFGINFGRIFPT